MDNLTFGEQVKVMLGRKGMTIKALAEALEAHTGKKMSRQNLTQRLGRDNFQEQDMRLIAEILGCPFHLNILPIEESKESSPAAVNEGSVAKQKLIVAGSKPTKGKEKVTSKEAGEDMTIGDIYDIHQGLSELEANLESGKEVEVSKEKVEKTLTKKEAAKAAVKTAGKEDKVADKPKAKMAAKDLDEEDFEPVIKRDDKEEDRELGEINPYTGREYQSNSVRMHPTRIGYVQVYDRSIHKWTDMTEWAFLGYQERMKNLLGQNYEPPIYLD